MTNARGLIKQMVDAGVKGYILKNTGLEELTKAILTVANNEYYYSNEVAQSLINKKLNRKVTVKTETDFFDSKLTKREKEILSLIVNEYTNSEIALKLYLSKRTIDGHRNKIINKLQLKNTAGLVKYAIQRGIF